MFKGKCWKKLGFHNFFAKKPIKIVVNATKINKLIGLRLLVIVVQKQRKINIKLSKIETHTYLRNAPKRILFLQNNQFSRILRRKIDLKSAGQKLNLVCGEAESKDKRWPK